MALNNLYAISLDGVDDNIVVPFSTVMQQEQFTIEMLFQLTNNAYFQTFLSYGGLVSDGWMIQRTSDGKLRLAWGSSYPNDYSGFDVSTNQVMISIVRNAGDVMFYINGVLVHTWTHASAALGQYDLVIGKRSDNVQFSQMECDELRLWNYNRSQLEIEYYKDRKLVGNEQGLVSYYRCDSGSGNILIDEINNNDATIQGGTWIAGEVDLQPPGVFMKSYDVTNISASSATLNGEIFSLGEYSQLDVAFQYSPYPDFSQDINQTSIQTITAPQVISANVTGLDQSTGYYVRMTAEGS